MGSARRLKIAAEATIETPRADLQGGTASCCPDRRMAKRKASCLRMGTALRRTRCMSKRASSSMSTTSWVEQAEQMIMSNIDVPQGKCVLGVEFVKEKLQAIRNSPVPNQCVGTASLYINDHKVGEIKGMTTQLGKFALCGEGLNIGRDGGAPVTFDYPGDQPGRLRGRLQARRGCNR